MAQSQYPRIVTWVLQLLHRRPQKPVITQMNGLLVQICPKVFNPITGRTTQFFIEHMHIEPRNQVLEIGTGSGAIAAAAANQAQSVIATDVNPYAVQCAQATMRLNGLEKKVSVLQGDLFAPVLEKRFDVVLFNPPYLAFRPQSLLAKAWSAGPNFELLEKFLCGVREVLTDKGEIQILLSSATALTKIFKLIRNAGFRIQVMAKERMLGILERIYLLRLS
ncbi:MAG: HemK2/MTQ2 family protein methyltransferase [Promethearchaeota archaeon]